MPDASADSFTPAPPMPEQVASYLQDLIVRGELAPGERIAEARVTEALKVSRGPVREAMRLLAARHLIEFLPRRGARVSSFGPEDVVGLYDLQAALMTLLVEQAALRWNDEHLPLIEEFRRRIDKAANASAAADLLHLSLEFQATGCRIARNPYLTETLERLAPAFARAHYRALAAGPRQRLDLAAFIGELLSIAIARQPQRAAAVVSAYAAEQKKIVLATYKDSQHARDR